MTREELVEKVARGICKAVGDEPDVTSLVTGLPIWVEWADEARAAVDIALEEAAKVAGECHFDEDDPGNDDRDRAYAAARRHAAKDIRALKSGGDE